MKKWLRHNAAHNKRTEMLQVRRTRNYETLNWKLNTLQLIIDSSLPRSYQLKLDLMVIVVSKQHRYQVRLVCLTYSSFLYISDFARFDISIQFSNSSKLTKCPNIKITDKLVIN